MIFLMTSKGDQRTITNWWEVVCHNLEIALSAGEQRGLIQAREVIPGQLIMGQFSPYTLLCLYLQHPSLPPHCSASPNPKQPTVWRFVSATQFWFFSLNSWKKLLICGPVSGRYAIGTHFSHWEWAPYPLLLTQHHVSIIKCVRIDWLILITEVGWSHFSVHSFTGLPDGSPSHTAHWHHPCLVNSLGLIFVSVSGHSQPAELQTINLFHTCFSTVFS